MTTKVARLVVQSANTSYGRCDRLAHLARSDAAGAFAPDIAGAEAGLNDAADRGVDGVRRGRLSEGVTQHHPGTEDLGDWIGDAAAGDVRGGATARFEEAEASER